MPRGVPKTKISISSESEQLLADLKKKKLRPNDIGLCSSHLKPIVSEYGCQEATDYLSKFENTGCPTCGDSFCVHVEGRK